MAQIVPLQPSIPLQDVTVMLDDEPWVFVVRWSGYDSAWYADVLEADRTPILRSIKLVLGTLLGQTSTHRFFAGRALFMLPDSRPDLEAGLDDLGERVRLVYLNAADLELARAPADDGSIRQGTSG